LPSKASVNDALASMDPASLTLAITRGVSVARSPPGSDPPTSLRYPGTISSWPSTERVRIPLVKPTPVNVNADDPVVSNGIDCTRLPLESYSSMNASVAVPSSVLLPSPIRTMARSPDVNAANSLRSSNGSICGA
jgi:hypothetical protein